jgi:hypothetical protein
VIEHSYLSPDPDCKHFKIATTLAFEVNHWKVVNGFLISFGERIDRFCRSSMVGSLNASIKALVQVDQVFVEALIKRVPAFEFRL